VQDYFPGGEGCVAAQDCSSGVCVGSRCQAAACNDAVQNQDETDVDCGGVCGPTCADGQACSVNEDCLGGDCQGGVCQAPAGSGCDEALAFDIGGRQFAITVPTDACLKITQYPGSWVHAVILQTQYGGTDYPVPYSWTNCPSSGGNTLNGDWDQQDLRTVSSACTTVVDLQGSGAGTVMLKWWGSG
jgi:hypothetical protein